jgi:hypothetical protein
MKHGNKLAFNPVSFRVGQARYNHALDNGGSRPYGLHQFAVQPGE